MNDIINPIWGGIKSSFKNMENKLITNRVNKPVKVKKKNRFGKEQEVEAPSPILQRLQKDAGDEIVDPNNLSMWQKTKALAMNDKGEYSGARIAGMGAAGYMGLSAAGRIASGGGLFRDADGNFDIIGIPIV